MRKEIKRILDGFSEGISYEVLIPEKGDFGHYSTNLAMKLAKKRGVEPLVVAREIADKIRTGAQEGIFARIEAAEPGFVNFWLNEEYLRGVFKEIYENRKDYGRSETGKGKKVIVEYSSPNIAKRMHVGHLRSTIIGDAISNIYEFLGYKVIRWNYIGDWGTQFGKLLAAYKLWGNKEAVKKDLIGEFLKLYVKFSREEKENPELRGRGQEEFRKLEAGDRENKKLWKWIREESLKEFNGIYSVLGIRFDQVLGESFFEKDLNRLVEDLLEQGLAQESEGAVILRLDKFGLSTALLRKSDGGSLYLTRELASLRYRLKKFKPDEILFVVANEQALHFEQLFAAAKLLEWNQAELKHVKFGLTLGEDGKKFATREGHLISLQDVLNKAIKMAREAVNKKNPGLDEEEKKKVAEVVGVGALKYYDLKENRLSDIVFDWNRMLDLKGNSAPYILYAYARLSGIINKSKFSGGKASYNFLEGGLDFEFIRRILLFPDAVEEAGRTLLTSGLAKYLYELASFSNRYYEEVPILKDDNELRRNARLNLVDMGRSILKRGLGLLGIEALENM